MRALALALVPCLLTAQAPETVTTQKDVQALAVTIYNDDLALVRDQREVRLGKGDLALAWQEVSGLIRPETALLKNLTEPKEFRIREQNFDFDLLTPAKLLEKYVGRSVTIVSQRPRPDGPGSFEVREDAQVLASNGGVVLRFKDRIETSAPGRIIYPEVPANLRARPTLVLSLHSPRERAQKLELSYLTGGLSWRADYVASLAADEKSLDLSGWVTLTNRSGAAYPEATLQLVAGDVHRAPRPMPGRRTKEMLMEVMASAPAPEMREESLFEYHLYTLDRPTTLLDNQTKQVALLGAQDVPVRKEFLLRGGSHYYQGRYDQLGDKLKVGVFIEFDNKPEARLGLPLPKGTVRVYKRDGAGRPQFVGEDAIDHTPKNETVRLKLGEAFDVTARRRQTDYRSLGSSGSLKNGCEAAFEVVLSNAKKEAVEVVVLEPMPGDWEILQRSHPFTKPAAGLARFLVTVPAEGSATLTYRTRVRW